MNSDWQQFLETQNANIEAGKVLNFNLDISEEHKAFDNAVICDLSHYGIIKASGEDATDFLQGQLTNDIKELEPGRSQLSAYCSPKGRMLCNFRIFMKDNDYYLRMAGDTLAPNLKRLRMFVMRSQVELEDVSDQWVRVGVAGKNADKILAQALSSLPENVDDVSHADNIVAIKLPGQLPRFELHGAVDALKEIWAQVAKQSTPVGADSWNILTIRAGIPEIVTDTMDAFVPQMANLHYINGLSFTKGCYPGQEVVARTHYLGKLKRRLFRATLATETLPKPGMGIVNAGGDGQKSGKVVSSSWAADGVAEILAVIQIASAENETLHLEQANGPQLNLADLPYSTE